MKLQELLNDYLEYLELERNMAQGTIRMYHFYLTDFLKHLNKPEASIEALSEDAIHNYRLDLSRRLSSKSAETIKKNTQKGFLVALRAFLKYLLITKNLKVLSPEKVILGKAEPSIPKFLNNEQLDRLLSVQNLDRKSGLRDKAILEVLFSTGLRVSELTHLNRESINFESKEFSVIGKGRKVRTVYLSDASVTSLKRYLATRKDAFKPLFVRYSGKTMEAGDSDGESARLSVRSVERMLEKYVGRSGISIGATPHTLRHTFATDLLSHGADLRSVQEMLGHSSLSTTQIYTHVTNQQLKSVHGKFHGKEADLLDSGSSPE
ncbi:MAG: tyrosine-type recombinase/integrase [candidate division WWE3 bacterium]|nr:tyrosine-type recombinase/integrase [candidate division WWE3 bacterium]